MTGNSFFSAALIFFVLLLIAGFFKIWQFVKRTSDREKDFEERLRKRLEQ